jgi:hypothetical protein
MIHYVALQQNGFSTGTSTGLHGGRNTMAYEQVAMTASQMSYEALQQVGSINQRTLDRITDLQSELVKRNLDAMIALSRMTASVWVDSTEAYLSMVGGIYRGKIDKMDTVTVKTKVPNRKKDSAVKMAKPKTTVARKRPS